MASRLPTIRAEVLGGYLEDGDGRAWHRQEAYGRRFKNGQARQWRVTAKSHGQRHQPSE